MVAGVATIFAVTDDSLLRDAGKEQVGQILKAVTTVHIHAASEAFVTQRVFTLFRKKVFPRFF